VAPRRGRARTRRTARAARGSLAGAYPKVARAAGGRIGTAGRDGR
jgi:hypothetical protein